MHGDVIRLGRGGGAELVFLLGESRGLAAVPAPRLRSATSATWRRCSRACGRSGPAACSTKCWRWCSTRRSRSAAPSAASSCWPAGGPARVQAGRGRGARHAAGQHVRDEPQDPARRCSRRASRASSPTCSTATWRTCTWAPWRSASVTCSACRCGWSATSSEAEAGHGEQSASACSTSIAASAARCCRLDAGGARDAGHRGGARDRERAALPRGAREGPARAGTADRGRDPAGAAAAGRSTAAAFFDAAGARAVPLDRRRLLRLPRPAGGGFGFALGDVAGKGAAGGAAERDGAGHFRRAGDLRPTVRRHAGPRQPRPDPPRHRVTLRDDVLRRPAPGRPAALLQCRAQSAGAVRRDRGAAPGDGRPDPRAVRVRCRTTRTTVRLDPGDCVVVFSDGISEALNVGR